MVLYLPFTAGPGPNSSRGNRHTTGNVPCMFMFVSRAMSPVGTAILSDSEILGHRAWLEEVGHWGVRL